MIFWIDRIDPVLAEPFAQAYAILKSYWSGSGADFDEENLREELWDSVDGRGGPRIDHDRYKLVTRMILCLAYKDHETIDELRDTGFFEDLLEKYGFSREEIYANYQGESI